MAARDGGCGAKPASCLGALVQIQVRRMLCSGRAPATLACGGERSRRSQGESSSSRGSRHGMKKSGWLVSRAWLAARTTGGRKAGNWPLNAVAQQDSKVGQAEDSWRRRAASRTARAASGRTGQGRTLRSRAVVEWGRGRQERVAGDIRKHSSAGERGGGQWKWKRRPSSSKITAASSALAVAVSVSVFGRSDAWRSIGSRRRGLGLGIGKGTPTGTGKGACACLRRCAPDARSGSTLMRRRALRLNGRPASSDGGRHVTGRIAIGQATTIHRQYLLNAVRSWPRKNSDGTISRASGRSSYKGSTAIAAEGTMPAWRAKGGYL